jgi:DNA topoisomerase VI subunit A
MNNISPRIPYHSSHFLHAGLTGPRFATEYWKKQISQELKSEQQAFAAWGVRLCDEDVFTCEAE